MQHTLEIADAVGLSTSDIRAIAAISWQAWPMAGSSLDERIEVMTRDQHTPRERDARFALVRVDGVPVASAKTFAREIETEAGAMTVVALAGVACLESHRGRGFGKAVVDASFDRVRDGAFEVCLFQTTTNVRPFYEKLGCRAVKNPTVNTLNAESPDARPWWDPEVMIFPGDSPRWPGGLIDLRGPAW